MGGGGGGGEGSVGSGMLQRVVSELLISTPGTPGEGGLLAQEVPVHQCCRCRLRLKTGLLDPLSPYLSIFVMMLFQHIVFFSWDLMARFEPDD